jgi:hypothetical protein
MIPYKAIEIEGKSSHIAQKNKPYVVCIYIYAGYSYM